jgi:hypothetical protein
MMAGGTRHPFLFSILEETSMLGTQSLSSTFGCLFWRNDKQPPASRPGGWTHLWSPIPTSSFVIRMYYCTEYSSHQKGMQPHRLFVHARVSQTDAFVEMKRSKMIIAYSLTKILRICRRKKTLQTNFKVVVNTFLPQRK